MKGGRARSRVSGEHGGQHTSLLMTHDTEEEGPIYKAAEDRECDVTRRESGEAMTRALQKLRRSRGVQVAYLQGCVGMKSEAAFTELIGFYGDASWVDPRKTQFRGGCQIKTVEEGRQR